jgi:hypothetical protein
VKKALALVLAAGLLGIGAVGCDGDSKKAETPKEFKPVVPGGPKASAPGAVPPPKNGKGRAPGAADF